ncbi:MAG: hypothetical protein OEL83_19880 [Desulforhopalus sp.]|nr:hypothetical protein [Desulforhopalus sp.]
MNKRNILRALERRKSNQSSIMNLNKKVAEYVVYAKNCIMKLERYGQFIMFSSLSGEAWLLDQRENLALRIADHSIPLQYRIEETKTKLFIEWTERYQISDGAFIAIRGEKQSVFLDYPVSELTNLLAKLQ